MTEISERYARLGDAFAAKIAAVPPDGGRHRRRVPTGTPAMSSATSSGPRA